MIIKANEIQKYMELHGVDKVPVEVINTEIPENKELRQKVRHLAKRLVITSAVTKKIGGSRFSRQPDANAVDAVYINYVMYNSFRKSQNYIPPEWEFDVLTGEVGEKILKEFADHGGNLEQHFRDAFAKYHPEIQQKVSEAAALLKEAEKLSEDHGVPFYPEASLVGGMTRGYFPHSFDSIFGDLMQENDDLVNELTSVYQYDGNTGWQSSANSC